MIDRTWAAGPSRRDLLKTFAAAGLGTLAPLGRLGAQNNPRRIDVHHHYALPDAGGGRGKQVGAAWTPALALEQMDKHGIETTIFSRPGGEAEAGGEKGRAFARRANEYIAKVVDDNRKRFGFFAVIPYSDTDGAVKELEYAYETLKADGVGLMSSI